MALWHISYINTLRKLNNTFAVNHKLIYITVTILKMILLRSIGNDYGTAKRSIPKIIQFNILLWKLKQIDLDDDSGKNINKCYGTRVRQCRTTGAMEVQWRRSPSAVNTTHDHEVQCRVQLLIPAHTETRQFRNDGTGWL